MKILHVTSSLDPAVGGVAQAVKLFCRELDLFQCVNEVATMDDPAVRWISVGGKMNLHALGPGKFGWGWSRRFRPWLRENLLRFDVVVVHGLWQYPSFAVNRELLRAGASKPRFYVMPHGMLDPYFQRAPERRLKAIRNWFYWKAIENRTIAAAVGVLFTCEEERRLAREPFRPYRPKSERVVGLGCEEPPAFEVGMEEAFRAKCPGLGARPYWLFLSRIHPKKGADLLLRAYVEQWTPASPMLVMAGPPESDEYLAKLKVLVPEKIRPSVFWPGMLSGAAKWGALHGCMAFVLPSHQENFGIAVVEAMACGRPVLISNRVNIWREIEGAGAGMIAEDTLAGTAELLAAEAPRLEAMGRAARACFVENFSIERAAKSFLAALELRPASVEA